MKDTAIVILNYNGRKHLETFLPSVVAHSTGARIIIADNCSTDDSVAFLQQEYPQLELLLLEKNTGYAGGYNRALAQIEATNFVLLNSDVQVSPGWLLPVIDLLQAQPTVAAIQPKILSYKEPHKFEYAGAAGGYLDMLGYPFCRGRIFDSLEEDLGQYEDARPIFWASGACLIIRSSAYFEAGGLDDDFFAHMEEIDLCWRLQRMGKKIMYCPQSTVYHLGGGTLAQGHPRKTYLNFRNGLFLLIKNVPVGQLLWVLPIRLALDAVAAWRFLGKGFPRDFWAVVKAHMAIWARFGQLWRKRRGGPAGFSLTSKHLYYPGSIVWAYFVRKKKKFQDLGWN